MHLRLGLLTSAVLSLTIAPLAIPANPVTRVVLAPAVAQTAADQMAEADRLIVQGAQQLNTSRYREALQSFQQALEIYQSEIVRGAFPQQSRNGEANALNNLGLAYRLLSQYQQAIEYFQQALPIFQAVEDRNGEAGALNNLGLAYESLSQYQQAIEYYQQALPIFQAVENRNGEAKALNNLGNAYQRLSQYQQAIEHYQQALPLLRAVEDRNGEAKALNNLGNAYRSLSQYQQAIEYFQQALPIYRAVEDRNGEAKALNNLGLAYQSLSQYQQAIEYLQQALPIYRAVKDRNGEAKALNNLGNAYQRLSQYQQAIEHYQQALPIYRAVEDRSGEAKALNNLGNAYQRLSQYQQAIEYYQQALPILQAIENRNGEANALMNLGLAYQSLSQYQQAIEYYQQALPIFQAVEDREGQGMLLANLGKLLELQEQPELAIVFLKQSVNVRESIRSGIRELPTDLQQSYTDSVADDYRKLADLLLQQNRVLEAQQVLDLLKVQELKDYLQETVRGNGQTPTQADYQPPEQRILDLYQQVIAEGTELAALRAQAYEALTPAQQQRLTELVNREGEILTSFNDFIRLPDVVAAVNQLRQTTQGQAIELTNFRTLQNNLQQLNQNAVLLYPLILGDRLELVLITATADAPIRYPVAVTAKDLNATILQFRQALENPELDVKPAAQQLYDWLIRPLEPYLTAANAKTLLYSPDGALRYVPLAALHDGNQWLIQRYAVTHITAASLTSFDATPRSQPLRLLAAACAQCEYSFPVGDRRFHFSNLPYARVEVETLADAVPGTDTLIDQAFNPTAIVPRLGNYSMVHLATHAAFVQGQPEESFIVFGNGVRVTLRAISGWNLQNADLVVLSACETGVGGFNFSEGLEDSSANPAVNPAANRTDQPISTGVEILGLGYQMQQAGAKAAIATLWRVSDGGTQVLMDAFYTALNDGHSKTEALQQAQLALINHNSATAGSIRGTARIDVLDSRTGAPPIHSHQLNHPYYWAPFILIGNGL